MKMQKAQFQWSCAFILLQ